jgi:hypothetical protein
MGLGTQASSGAGAGINMIPSSTLTNWFVGSNYVNPGAFEIIPSTAGGGSTFSTPALVLNSSGNLGLGVTPSAWASGIKAIDIGAGSAIFNPDSSAQTWIYNNAYNNAGAKYKNSGVGASWYQMVEGGHAWYSAPSGTAGNAITFTQAMTLNASGNLLVGGTTGTAGGKLTVTTANAGYVAVEPTSSVTSQIATGLRLHGNINETDRYVGIFCFNGAANNVNSMTFWTTNSGSSSERMRLDNSGNLGVGTTSPTFASGSGIEIQRESANATLRLDRGTTGDSSLELRAESGQTAVWTTSSTPMLFATGNTERARIDSSGNLIQTVNTTAATLATNGTLTFSIVDNSTLRISVRGSDGTTRTATVALT